ncbi:MAG: hypothetical protein HKN68_15410 [Saprospiraceae bacterium]|nr:hypothetical protein [Saprospiraceae bacterium]
MMMFQSKKRRYPGTKPFTRDQASLFFGRTEDIKRLNELIALESVVVVYGKSGYGKSSLVNAGLLPQLESNSKNLCLMPRLNAWKDAESISPLQKTRESIKELSKDYTILDKVLEDDDTLWRKLKAFQLSHPKKRLHLFFDQFEELFTYPASQINDFKKQIAELVRRQIPRRYERALDVKGADGNEVLTYEEEDRLYNNLNLRIVFIIRSDKMHLLDQLSDYLPKILRNNYEIRALSKRSATEALVAPALLKGSDFITPPFRYDKSAQEKVLDFLEDDSSGLVEAIQLQILATSFEDKVHKDQIELLDSDNIGNLESIVKNYYNDRLRSIGNYEEIALASKMIEEGLVDKERHQRLTLHEGQIKSIYEVDEMLLNKLVENHLLRRQPDSRSGYNYELSHDTLIAPVLAARTIRVQKEAEEEHLNTQKQLAKEKGRRRKATFIAVLAILASILAGYYAYKAAKQEKTILAQKTENEAQQIINENQELENVKQKRENEAMVVSLEIEKSKTDSLLSVAKVAEYQAQQALRSAQVALSKARIAEIEALNAKEKFASEVKKGTELEEVISGNNPYAVDFLTEEGDRQLANNNYQNALTYYATAKFVLEPDTINNQLTYQKILERIQISSLMSEIESLFKSGFFTLCSDKIKEIDSMDISDRMFERIDASLINRVTQMDTSENEWSKALVNGINQYGNVEAIEYMNIGSPSKPSKFVSLPYMGTERVENLIKLSITTSMKELYLKSIPTTVDSLEISHSGIVNIPPIDYSNSYLSYLKISDCLNLKAVGEEILNYDLLESLVITGNPNIERVTFDISELNEIKHLELSDNPNLTFIPYFLCDYSNPNKVETLIMKNMELNDETILMGSSELTKENILNVEFGDVMGDLIKLRNLEIDNVFFDDLIEHQFDFIYYPYLERLRLANLNSTKYIPSISTLENLKELSIENLPINNDLTGEISSLTGLTKLVLSDLNNLPKWSDLSSLVNLRHLTLKRIPNVINIGNVIKSLPNLEYLELDGINVDEELDLTVNTLNQLKVLKINNCNINNLEIDPLILSSLEELEMVGLRDMYKRSSAFDSIGLLNNLQKLKITTHDPQFINNMTNLKELDIEFSPLGFNRMSGNEIPEIFRKELNITNLYIRDAYITELPNSLSEVQSLESITLHGTTIKSINELARLPNLKEIILINNSSLRTLPGGLRSNTNLERIIFYNTNLDNFNQVKSEFSNIEFLKVNSIEKIRSLIKN